MFSEKLDSAVLILAKLGGLKALGLLTQPRLDFGHLKIYFCICSVFKNQ